MGEKIDIPKDEAVEKKKIDYYARKKIGLKAKPEDDGIVREIIQLLAKKGITVDRAYKILKDVRTLLPRFAKLPYKEDSKYES